MIHCIWLGDLPSNISDRVEHFRAMNPDDAVMLWTDDAELHPDYREAWEHRAPTPQAKSDLLRYSVLEKYGGWYFDMDTTLLVPASKLQKHVSGDRFAYSLLHLSQTPNPDVLYCPLGWTGWPVVRRLIAEYRPTRGFDILAYAGRMLAALIRELPGCVEAMDDWRLFPNRPRHLTDKALVLRSGLKGSAYPSRGLGDTIAKITTKLGIKPCKGCKKRQKWLNKIVPYGDRGNR